MSTQADSNFKSFSFSSAVSAYRFVQPSTTTAGGAVVAVTGSRICVGSLTEDVAAGGIGTVKLFHPTFFATVSGTAAVGDVVKFDASGLVTTAASNTITAGVALETAVDGSVIEIAVNQR